MSTTLLQLLNDVNEELKIDWAGGEGFSREFVVDKINDAMSDLSEWTTIRDTTTMVSVAEQTEYDIVSDITTTIVIENINSVKYDGRKLTYIQPREYGAKSIVDEGVPSEWTLWGTKLIVVGEVEAAKVIELKVVRTPARVDDDDDIIELPRFTEMAIKYYAVAACYRQSKDFDRSNFYDYKLRGEKRNIANRATPQVQQEALPVMTDDYWPAERRSIYTRRSDTNPGGV